MMKCVTNRESRPKRSNPHEKIWETFPLAELKYSGASHSFIGMGVMGLTGGTCRVAQEALQNIVARIKRIANV